MEVKVKKLNSAAILPRRGSAQAAGYDLFACLPEEGAIVLQPGETRRIPMGLALALPEGTFGAVFARSGLATRQGLRPANCVGVVDSDYRGENMVPLHNDSGVPQTIRHGDRVAQMVVLPYLAVDFLEADALDETERGQGGLGSTGK